VKKGIIMSNNPPAPELVEAYRLIKAGQKSEAGHLLKAYLTHTKDDPQAWWLMSHAVSNPATARRCLETVLTLDPGHEKARARLAKLSQMTEQAPSQPAPATSQSAQAAPPALPAQPVEAASPAPAPVPSASADDDDFPSDEMVLAGLTMSAAVPAHAPASTASAQAGSFEDFLAADQTRGDPFAGPPTDDPFAPAAAAAAPVVDDPFAPEAPVVDDPFAPEAHTAASADSAPPTPPTRYDPFATENVFDPSAGVGLGHQSTAQTAGTGNQPDWGPGLAFVPDSTAAPILTADDLRVERRRKSGPNPLLIIGGFFAAALVVVLLYVVYSAFSGREKVPPMTTMDIPAFSIDYPKGWDQRCEVEQRGYPVCGMANHKWYNEVDYFAGTDVNLGEMFGDLFGFGFTGQDLPDEAVSIIAMDVPRTSLAYDDASWAKTLYEWNFGENPTYSKKMIKVDGYEAYYYEFKSKGSYFTWAAWDVYILHDDVVFWLRVDFSGDGKKTIPQKMVNKMIESIDIK
jgi:hypothetical protein